MGVIGKDIPNHFREIYKGNKYTSIAGGGSVANYAFSLAIKLGFKTIILVGQDLAFTGGRGHTRDAYDDEDKNRRDAAEVGSICEVEAIDGGMVKTESRMRSYLKWFENSIAAHNDIEVIDATEGGALIHGSRVMTLRQAIQDKCSGEFTDYREIIDNIPPQFTPDEQKEIFKYLAGINDRLDELRAKLESGIGEYKKLAQAVRNNDVTGARKAMEEVSKVNELEKEDILFEMLESYTADVEYDVKDELYNSEADDTMAAINGGIRMLRTYIAGIDTMKTETHLMTDRIKN